MLMMADYEMNFTEWRRKNDPEFAAKWREFWANIQACADSHPRKL